MSARRIALLGARSTGKTRLSTELAAHLRDRGLHAVAVPEVLREWCTREGRPPRPEEQLAIAREQERRTDDAAAQSDIVIADTTALMVALYAGMLFPEGELLRFAIENQKRYDATLLTGLDLPWVADRLQCDAAQTREELDALLRSLLHGAQLSFQVIYGQGPQRLDSALQALVSSGVLPARIVERTVDGGARRAWAWVCEKCSDPACEHRLFQLARSADEDAAER